MSVLTMGEIQAIVQRSKKSGSDDFAVLSVLLHICIALDEVHDEINEISERLDEIESQVKTISGEAA